MTVTTLINTYWDTVARHVSTHELFDGPCVDWTNQPYVPRRADLVSRYSWTITDPDSVAFVVAHAQGRVLDPMAGSGWWCRLLDGAGIDVAAYDEAPPHHGGNRYHKAGISHLLVHPGDAVQAVIEHGRDRTLLLSWPPYDNPIGVRTLAAYLGDRVIYIGEGEGGCCGDDDLFDLLASQWRQVAEHRPVQWWGMHDYITVYERRDGAR